VLTGGGGVGTNSGTSFAAPQAAGYAACLMQAYPMVPPAIIRKTFDSIADLSRAPTPKRGYGIPDFRKAQSFLRRLLYPDSVFAVAIYPNPFSTSISVQLPKASSTIDAVKCWDMSGREIGLLMQQDADIVTLSPYTGLSSGIYVLRLIIDGEVYTRKLLHTNQ
jgi:hypothetical protein